MSWIAVAIGGSAVLGFLGASNSADAASSAANAQAGASAASIAEQRRQYDLARADQAPFRESGVAGNARMRALLGLTPGYKGADSGSLLRRFSASDLNADPVYQSGLKFGIDQGTAGINARAIAGGSYDSGATLKALTRFGNDYGSTKANESYNRYNADQSNIYNRLAGISGTGQTATNQIQAAGTSMANSVSGSLADAGNARAAGIVGGANAWNNFGGQVSGLANNYSNNQVLQQLLSGYGGGGGGGGTGYDQAAYMSYLNGQG